jgi:hypothetical protein
MWGLRVCSEVGNKEGSPLHACNERSRVAQFIRPGVRDVLILSLSGPASLTRLRPRAVKHLLLDEALDDGPERRVELLVLGIVEPGAGPVRRASSLRVEEQ